MCTSLSSYTSLPDSLLFLLLLLRKCHINKPPPPYPWSHYWIIKVRYSYLEFSITLFTYYGDRTSLYMICIHFQWHSHWRRLCTSNRTIPTRRHHGWYWLIRHRASPGSVVEVLQGWKVSYFLLFLLPLAIFQAIYQAVVIYHTIFIVIVVPLFPLPHPPPPLQIPHQPT